MLQRWDCIFHADKFQFSKCKEIPIKEPFAQILDGSWNIYSSLLAINIGDVRFSPLQITSVHLHTCGCYF